MKIAIVINKSWNIYNFRMGLIKLFQELGHSVITIAPEDDFTPNLIDQGCKFVPVSISAHGTNPFSDIKLMMDFYKIYKKEKPDVILHYTIKPNIYGTLAAQMLKIPTINNVTGLGTVFLRDTPLHKLAQKMYQVAFRYPQKIFFQNQDDIDLFIEKKISFINNSELVPGSGVDTNKFVPKPFVRNNTFTFLLVARIYFDKGIIEYIEAIKQLKKKDILVKFQLLGQIDEKNPIGISQQLVDSWVSEGLIEFISFKNDILPYLYHSDCVVLPSYREGLPKSLLEAMSVGKPIITTNVPGCRELVVDKLNGYICEVKNSISLAQAMEKMFNLDNEKLTKMGEESRNMVMEKFDQKYVFFKYVNAINSIKVN